MAGLKELQKDKSQENKENETTPKPAEKPISLAGASFVDVLRALLETKSKPKEDKERAKNDE